MGRPSEKIRFGVIGCSRVAERGMIPAICDSDLAELVIIGKQNDEEEKTKTETVQPYCAVWGTYDEIINSKDVDAVYVSLPNALHEEWTIKAAEKGKHVLCEKPAALSYASAQRMVAAARKSKARLIEGLMFRYHPQNVKVMEWIKEGVLGGLLRFESCFAFAMPDRASNAMNKNLGGGSFNDQGPYGVATSRMVFGEEPVSVLCSMKTDVESGVDVMADMVLYYPNEKIAFSSTLFGSYYQSTYSVLSTKAHVRMARAYAVPRDMKTKIFLDADDEVQEFVIEPADHFRLMVDDFVGEILKGEWSRKDFEGDLLAQARVLEAARVSAREQRIVHLSEIV